MRKKLLVISAAVLFVTFGFWPPFVNSAEKDAAYPTRPVSTIVAYPAGGETDIGARIVAGIAEKD